MTDNTTWLRGNRELIPAFRAMFGCGDLPWDHYAATMAEVDVAAGKTGNASKSFSIRKAPFGGAYALLGGLSQALQQFEDHRFTPQVLEQLEYLGIGKQARDYFAEGERLRLKIWALPEGTPFFPHEPAVVVYGPLPHVRLAEGIAGQATNFGSLSLTKWHRLVRASRPGGVLEFSRRRAQNHLLASVYAACAGATATSNGEILRYLDIPVKGTHGHEGPQSRGNPRVWFDEMLRARPQLSIGLVDTVNCMEVDFPAWLDAVYEHREAVKREAAIWGWRNDSGALASLYLRQVEVFMQHSLARDPWFVQHFRAVLGGGLDEYKIADLITEIYTTAREEGDVAGFSANELVERVVWAVGDSGGSATDQPVLGGVMKLGEVDGAASRKLALDAEGNLSSKASLAGFNLSANVFDKAGEHQGVIIYPFDESPTSGRDVVMCAMHNPVKRTLVERAMVIPKHQPVFDSIDGDGLTEAGRATTIDTVRVAIEGGTRVLRRSALKMRDAVPPRVSVTEELFALNRRMAEGWKILDS